MASVSRKVNGIREFCNVTPSPPSPHSVVLHRGREALMHMPYHSETVVRDVHANVWKVTESTGGVHERKIWRSHL